MGCAAGRVKGAAYTEVAGACAWPDEGVRTEITLDVGGNDLAGDAFARHKPLVHPHRHGEYRLLCEKGEQRKEGTDVSAGGAKQHGAGGQGGARLQKITLQRPNPSARMGMQAPNKTTGWISAGVRSRMEQNSRNRQMRGLDQYTALEAGGRAWGGVMRGCGDPFGRRPWGCEQGRVAAEGGRPGRLAALGPGGVLWAARRDRYRAGHAGRNAGAALQRAQEGADGAGDRKDTCRGTVEGVRLFRGDRQQWRGWMEAACSSGGRDWTRRLHVNRSGSKRSGWHAQHAQHARQSSDVVPRRSAAEAEQREQEASGAAAGAGRL